MPSHYDPQEHIQHLEVAPRAEGILDQREITIQSYQTTIPFDFARLNQGIESAWLTPQIRFGVFARTPLTGDDALHVVLGLQDELSVRAYDYDARRPLWFTWQNVIVDTVGVRYFRDNDGFLVFKTTGGGRRITEDLLNDFNSSFLGIPRNAVRKRDFDLQKLRKLCFDRFVDRLYMLRFADPSAEEYRSIEHALFQSRKWMDREVERLHEIQADPQVRIESFEADVDIRAEDLAGLTTVRFLIRGLSGSLRLKFPKLEYKNEPTTLEEQARVFYRLVDIAEGSILDADYYTRQPRSLDELDVELGLFEDNVDLTQFREVLMNKDARHEFFQSLDLSEMWHKWRPLTPDEAKTLLKVAGPRKLVYMTALGTGLRRLELVRLQWRDVAIDGPGRACLELRAEATKAKRADVVPLPDHLVRALRAVRPEKYAPTDPVFAKVPDFYYWHEDLNRAGIKYRGADGRIVGFHSMRVTFVSELERAGVSPRTIMELARHRDYKLTAGTYTDVRVLDTFGAAARLPAYDDGPQAERQALRREGTNDAPVQVDQILDQKGCRDPRGSARGCARGAGKNAAGAAKNADSAHVAIVGKTPQT